MDVAAVVDEMKRQAIRTEEKDPAISTALWNGVLLIEDLLTPDDDGTDPWPES
jgi:hypothetical protein